MCPTATPYATDTSTQGFDFATIKCRTFLLNENPQLHYSRPTSSLAAIGDKKIFNLEVTEMNSNLKTQFVLTVSITGDCPEKEANWIIDTASAGYMDGTVNNGNTVYEYDYTIGTSLVIPIPMWKAVTDQ